MELLVIFLEPYKLFFIKSIIDSIIYICTGHALTTYDAEQKQAIIGFDMGGTSTDVSRYDGKYEHVFETITAGYIIQTPQLDINTIAAGGGSMLFFRAGMFVVGPESASSNPGPACYKKGKFYLMHINPKSERTLKIFFTIFNI